MDDRAVAEALAAGDLDSAIDLDARNELGDLASTFDEMRRSLRKSLSEIEQQNEELRAARDDLERRVEERSAELADVQRSLADAETAETTSSATASSAP